MGGGRVPGWRTARLDGASEGDFFRLHAATTGHGWCACVAWWVPTWDGWGTRAAEENRALRAELFARGEHDGYLAWAGAEPIAWCQVGPRDRLEKLRLAMGLAPDASAWAISCVLVAPAWRGRGTARALLADVLADLRARGVRRVEAYPRRVAAGEACDALDAWTGPEALFRAAGFVDAEGGDARRRVLALDL